MKRLLVTGSREFNEIDLVEQYLREGFYHLAQPEFLPWSVTLVHGACPTGADALANLVWKHQDMPIDPHPADWEGPLKKGAGFARNAEMVKLGADLCISFWQVGAANKGTMHCSDLAQAAGIETWRVLSNGTCYRG